MIATTPPGRTTRTSSLAARAARGASPADPAPETAALTYAIWGPFDRASP